VLEGLKIALDHLDAVITLIRRAQSPDVAREGLMRQFQLSEIQANAILDMKLQRLTQLERNKLIEEYQETIKRMEYLRSVLGSEALVRKIIKDELEAIQRDYRDERRTQIIPEEAEINVEDTEKTSEEQAGADQQDAGKRDFTDDEKRAETVKVLAFGRAAAGTGKASTQIRGGDEKAGREAEEGCSDGGDERSPEKRGTVNFHGAEQRKRGEYDQSLHAPRIVVTKRAARRRPSSAVLPSGTSRPGSSSRCPASAWPRTGSSGSYRRPCTWERGSKAGPRGA